ncbi:NupC/NupG family nucleoside CNT transporter [Pontibacter akesuensis]|uniref:Concentrative nucleoside transporter, CNT family n=1 Tax=Pontibacter akesuensis TaxID=388950 RepID=A0A1I7FLU5_9BACT|nr:nucleoside transporter C-terminal domain-containing protein [Pontibacter akesuensis]GHA61560.1 nucleoside transporter NupC [Pontibacter akesuensis]SFU37125.1 concentrative nucleoside transporter, CNT family [Pontibacter akesuensis]
MYDIFRGALGLVVLVAIAILFSKNRRAIDWKLVAFGLFLQIFFGVMVTQVAFVADAFAFVSKLFVKLLSFSQAGAEFLFGNLANPAKNNGLGFIFAFSVLPTIIFFSTVSAGLYYLGVLQKIVFGIAWVMSKGMRLSGAESLSAAGNIFLGQTEAPLLVRPFIARMTRSELMCLMTGGMATLAGGVLAAYVAFLGGSDLNQQAIFAAHLLTASVMNAPAGIVLAKILVPETEHDKINTQLEVNEEQLGVNLVDALSRGASDGLRLAANVGGMLLAFIAVIALLNYVLIKLGSLSGLNEFVVASTSGQFDGFSFQYILGQIFRVFAFIMGVPWEDTLLVGSLLGQKTAVNEFVAYLDLANMKAAGLLGEKALIMSTYALCGFSNFSSIAIQVGGIGSMAPNQQGNLSKLGFLALLGASLACMMTATVAGMLYGI